jgi:cytoskeletal protein RodZ
MSSRVLVLGLVGALLATVLGFAAYRITRETLSLPAVRVEAVGTLSRAPTTPRRPQRARTEARTQPQPPPASATTETEAETETETETEAETETDEGDDGSGRGRGRGRNRGRGGDDD